MDKRDKVDVSHSLEGLTEDKQLGKPDDRLLTSGELLDYHKRKYPHMYQGNDDDWVRGQRNQLENLFNTTVTILVREAQLAKCDLELKARLERIKEDIEKHKIIGNVMSGHFDRYCILITDIDWEECWKEKGIK